MTAPKAKAKAAKAEAESNPVQSWKIKELALLAERARIDERREAINHEIDLTRARIAGAEAVTQTPKE